MSTQQKQTVILASNSPRRQQLLTQIGVNFEVLGVEIDEAVIDNENALDYVVRMAKQKALAGYEKAKAQQIKHLTKRALIAADTCVVLEQKILGKPKDSADARQMLASLSASQLNVMTAVALINQYQLTVTTSVSQVCFAKLSSADIEEYCQLGEGMDKAGGFAIQGVAGQFIESIEGSYSGIVGLPLYETAQLLKDHYARCVQN